MVKMVMMMILMESSVMAMTMASISPSGREFPPADPVCRRAFLSLVFFRLVAAAELLSVAHPDLRFL